MPSYSPLPEVLLDPRNEAELVQQAARRVYEASNATLNDFSSGSPIMALLEGQAFAQAEFLQFANQFPESVLVEWIGPFLGAQRRTGSGSLAYITFTITPRDEQFDVFPGYLLSTDPALTGGDSIAFVTTERLIIPPGETKGVVRAVSVFKGQGANVLANTIVRSETSLAGVVSVTNEEAASGGQDAELLSEVKERFFSLIRRRNPVSAEDWEDWFTDAIGPGTSVAVLPRRSERDTYIYGGPYPVQKQVDGAPFVFEYGGNYITSNPSVAFFVLNPDATPITSVQMHALQNMMKWSLPTEFLGYVYPMEVCDVDFTLDLKYDPTKPYAQDMISFSKTVRDNLFNVMTPNAVFPAEYQQQVTDVESALTATFPLTLGTTNQFVDPDIGEIKAYHPPVQIGTARFPRSKPQPLVSGSTIKKDDLVLIEHPQGFIYYPALEDFNPSVNDKHYYVNTDQLDIELIRGLEPGEYKTGDVVYHDMNLHVVLTDFAYNPGLFTIEDLIYREFVSEAKTFTPWEPGEDVFAFDNMTEEYNPQIFAYETGDLYFEPSIPRTPTDVPPTIRVGAPVFVANKDFTIAESSTKLGTAQQRDLVSTLPVGIDLLLPEKSYGVGEYVKTPTTNELHPDAPDKYNCYFDYTQGVREIYAIVRKGFTFEVVDRATYQSSFDLAVEHGLIEIVNVIPFQDCKGDPTFSLHPFRYEARFFAGEYIRYRPQGGFNVDELERCVREREGCALISETCRRLFDQNLPLPRYFYVLKDFTPYTHDLDKMEEDEMIVEVDSILFVENYAVDIPPSVEVTTETINRFLIGSNQIASTEDLAVGDTCAVRAVFAEEPRGVWVWTGEFGGWEYGSERLAEFREMFRFAPGDVASFRYVSEIRTYEATTHVTPLNDLEVLYDNGVFIRSDRSETVKWFDPSYHLEDILYDFASGAPSFYRTIRSFTPPSTREIWSGAEAPTTLRIEELYRNTLKMTVLASCSDEIKARLRDGSSVVKLGTCQLNLSARSQGLLQAQFVFESTTTIDTAAPVSHSPGNGWPYLPVDYGTGTLAL